MTTRRRSLLLALALSALAVPALAAGGLAPALRIQPGEWELRPRGDGDARTTRLCLADAESLVQLRHPRLACERLVIENAPQDLTVQYTCRGQGQGYTRIHRETDALLQVESQGIAGGRPFAVTLEARRIGRCGG